MLRRLTSLAMASAAWFCAADAAAVRPFITDDARVVGKRNAQLETWLRWERTAFQHWIVPAVGPVAPLELSLGAVHGIAIDPDRLYSLSAPLLQAKLLLHEAKPGATPGIALIAGSFLPFGFGGFESPPNAFGYVAATEVIGEDALLLHANVGVGVARVEPPASDTAQELEKHQRIRMTWGIASQIHLLGPTNLAIELFSGDPYAEVAGGAAQAGLRFSVTPNVQLDTSAGGGLWGEPLMPLWVSSGFRIVRPGVF